MHDGDGFYWDADTGVVTPLNVGQGVIMIPDKVHCYGGDHYCEDAISFTGPLADQMHNLGLIKPGIVHLGRHRKLMKIISAVKDPSVSSQYEAMLLLQQMLFSLYMQDFHPQPDDIPGRVLDLITEILEHPERWWSLDEMSKYCNLCQRHFRRVFRKATGLTPKLYVDNVKINQACELLACSDLNIAEIAEELGYRDPYHFSRRFKAITGQSPKKSRLV